MRPIAKSTEILVLGSNGIAFNVVFVVMISAGPFVKPLVTSKREG